MITDELQLREALRKFAGYELALEQLKDELFDDNPELFAATMPGYLDRMRKIRLEIEAWLQARTNPAA